MKGVPFTSRMESPGRSPTRSATLPSSTLEMYTPTRSMSGENVLWLHKARTHSKLLLPVNKSSASRLFLHFRNKGNFFFVIKKFSESFAQFRNSIGAKIFPNLGQH